MKRMKIDRRNYEIQKRVNDEVTHFEVRGLKSELGSKGQDTG